MKSVLGVILMLSPELVPHYCQGDPKWAHQFIGRTHETIQQVGCAITSYAMLMSARHGFEIHPNEVDHWLTMNGGYQGDAVIWQKLWEYNQQFKELFDAIAPSIEYVN